MKPGKRAWSLWSTANGVLATATEPTPTTTWAAGVYLLHHSIDLAAVWAGQHPLDGDHGRGGTIPIPGGGTRTYDVGAGRVRIEDWTGGGSRRTALTIRTRAVEALVAVDRVPAALIAAAELLHAERRRLSAITLEHNDRYLRGDNPPGPAERLAHGAAEADVERRCRDAAAGAGHWQPARKARHRRR